MAWKFKGVKYVHVVYSLTAPKPNRKLFTLMEKELLQLLPIKIHYLFHCQPSFNSYDFYAVHLITN